METIYAEKSQEERLALLNANCRAKEKQQVKVFFSEDDLMEMKSRLSEHSIDREKFEDELKLLSAGLRGEIKIKTKAIKELLVFLKDKYEYQEQEVFEFDDQDQGLMLTYNSLGELINSRKLRPSERQTRMLNINKTA